MALDDEILAGFAAMADFAGESFTLSGHAGTFAGVFRGDDAPSTFDDLQGYDTKTTNAISVPRSAFTTGQPPLVNEVLTRANGDAYAITGVESVDDVTWDLLLQKFDA